jgi:hypothetical protein
MRKNGIKITKLISVFSESHPNPALERKIRAACHGTTLV